MKDGKTKPKAEGAEKEEKEKIEKKLRSYQQQSENLSQILLKEMLEWASKTFLNQDADVKKKIFENITSILAILETISIDSDIAVASPKVKGACLLRPNHIHAPCPRASPQATFSQTGGGQGLSWVIDLALKSSARTQHA